MATWIPAGVAWPQASATAVSPAATFAEVSQKVAPLLLLLLLLLDDDELAPDEEVDDAAVDDADELEELDAVVDELVDELVVLDALDVLPPPEPGEFVALLHAARAIAAASGRLGSAYTLNRLRVVEP